jgi:hypothetical protein
MKELKYHKNSKFEIVFENLDEIKEDDNILLRLKEGDLSPLFYTTCFYKRKIFIPYIPEIDDIAMVEIMHRDGFGQSFSPQFTTFDLSSINDYYYFDYILPKWNISEDSAVLFLSEEDCDRYNKNDDCDTYFVYPCGLLPRVCSSDMDITDYKNISIILPQLHAGDKSCPYHIENVNKFCKELKEKYGVERIELFVSHCFGYLDVLDWENCKGKMETLIYFQAKQNDDYDAVVYDSIKLVADKITTTNSTGILEVQKSERLEVIDCVEFFNI